MLRDIFLRLRALFFHRRMDEELDEELQFHLEMQARKNRGKDLDPAEAERQARLQFGSVVRAAEECREQRGISSIEILAKDVRFSLRMLRKSRGFTAVAVITLALAIGANALVFGVLNALILRPVNVPRAESLCGIERGKWGWQSYPDYLDFRDRNRSFDDLAAFNITAAGLDTGENPSRAWIYEVTGNYFEVLGIQPYLGRVFHGSDEHGPNSAPYIVLTYAYWHSHFHNDHSVVGRTVLVNKHPFTVVGVAPPGFHGTFLPFSPDFFVPIVQHGQMELENRGGRWVFETIGHLKARVTPAQAIDDLNSIGSWLANAYPKEDGSIRYSLARPGLYGSFIGGPTAEFVAALMLLAGLILLAACANLGSLFAARAADRSREVALRLALGAGRGRILRQLFTEAVLISLFGGAIGLGGSVELLRGLSLWQPFPRFPITIPVSPDANVYAVALLLSLASGFLFGAVPVRQVLHTNPYEIVKSGSLGRVGRRTRMRDGLLVVQVAICAVLVTSSLVALRGLVRSQHSTFGFEPHNAILVDADLSMAGYGGEAVPPMQKRMIEAIGTIPDVVSVGIVDEPPLTLGGSTSIVFTDQTTDLRPGNAAAGAFLYMISPDYFRAAGTAFLEGRSFTWHDDKNAPPVAVVNQEFARKLFGSVKDAVGRYYKRRDGTRTQVVGVVENGKYLNLTEDQQPAMFLPMLQSSGSQTWLIVRSTRDPQQLAPAIRRTLRDLDAGLPLLIETWNEALNGPLFPAQMATVALGVLGAMGAVLSITGIFGLAAYSVGRRMRELGIRLALGAQRKEVLQAALERPVKLLVLGSAAGLLLGILGTRVLAFLVYQATPRDPLVLAGVVLAMLLVGLLATWIPAHRALSIDPLVLLREE